jgi:hypothetical protein
MKNFFGLAAATLLLAGCADSKTGNETKAAREGVGGSMAGAGGAGPGYDGSGSGSGKYGTVPESGAAAKGQVGNSQTNSAMPKTSNKAETPPTPPSPQP